jgi:hypothetical protein
LQVIDRYTAALSPRGSRPGRDAKEATRSAIRGNGSNSSNDEVGLALLLTFGLYPPGSYVRLATGETGIVLQPGKRPSDALVSTVLNKRGEPIGIPRVVDTTTPEHAIVGGVSGSEVRVRLNEELLLRQIAAPRGNADAGLSSR